MAIQNNPPRSNGAEDILADVDPTAQTQPPTAARRNLTGTTRVDPRKNNQRPAPASPFRSLALSLILIVLVAAGGWYGWRWWQHQPNNSAISNTQNANSSTNTPTSSTNNSSATVTANTNTNTNTNTAGTVMPDISPATDQPVDSDHDGLTDEEEKKLGTNPQSSDTDGDGLSDLLEVRVYHSSPTDPDTDHDGISDGDAVKKGLNPAGGKLFDLSNSINSSS